MTVQADASVAFALMEQILHNVNNDQISVMRSFCKQVHDPIIFPGFNHLVVNDNQVAFVDILIGIIFQRFRDPHDKFDCWYHHQ